MPVRKSVLPGSGDESVTQHRSWRSEVTRVRCLRRGTPRCRVPLRALPERHLRAVAER